jgi:hypothetical protein
LEFVDVAIDAARIREQTSDAAPGRTPYERESEMTIEACAYALMDRTSANEAEVESGVAALRGEIC